MPGRDELREGVASLGWLTLSYACVIAGALPNVFFRAS
jgi:hypothetical protein